MIGLFRKPKKSPHAYAHKSIYLYYSIYTIMYKLSFGILIIPNGIPKNFFLV